MDRLHRLEIEPVDGEGAGTGSLSDSTVDEPFTFSSLSAVRGRVPRTQSAALRATTRQASLRVRPSWGVRRYIRRTGWDCVPAVAFNSRTRRTS